MFGIGYNILPLMLTIQGTKGNNKLLLGNKGGSMETEFYKIFTALCEERGVKKTRACIDKYMGQLTRSDNKK